MKELSLFRFESSSLSQLNDTKILHSLVEMVTVQQKKLTIFISRFHRRYKYYIAGNVTSIFSSTIVIVNAKWLQSILIIYTIERIALGHILFESLHILTHASLSRVCWVQVSNSNLFAYFKKRQVDRTYCCYSALGPQFPI